MPVLADVETVWIPRELVLMPVLADVETVWIPSELVLMPRVLVLALVETV